MPIDCRFLVRVSYLEIYNEEVRDLLGKNQQARLEVSVTIYGAVILNNLGSTQYIIVESSWFFFVCLFCFVIFVFVLFCFVSFLLFIF